MGFDGSRWSIYDCWCVRGIFVGRRGLRRFGFDFNWRFCVMIWRCNFGCGGRWENRRFEWRSCGNVVVG